MTRLLRLYRDAFAGLPLRVWLICLVAFVNRAGTMVVPFLTLWLTEKLGYRVDQAGLLMLAFGAGSVAGASVGGPLADRYGGTSTMAWSLVSTGVAFLALGQMHDVVGLCVALFAVGLCGDALRPASFAMIASNSPAAVRPRAFALLRLAVNLGWAIGPTVGGWVAEIEYAWLFALDAATCFGACAALIAVRAHLKPIHAAHGEDTMPDRNPLRDKRFVAFACCVFVLAVVFLQFMYTVPLEFRHHYHLEKHTIGWLSGINAVVIVLCEMALVHALRHRRPLRMCALGALFTGTSFWIIGFGSTVWFGVLVVVLWTFGEMLESPQAMVWASARAGARSRGRYVSVVSAMWSLAMLVAPAVGPAVWEHAGPSWLWGGCFVCGSFAALGYLALDRLERRDGR